MTGVTVELKCFELECFDGSQDEGCRRCPEYVSTRGAGEHPPSGFPK
jgi:hypothetical protein